MSWEQLISIYKEAREIAREEATTAACPNDGEPLREGPNGLYCPFDGWIP